MRALAAVGRYIRKHHEAVPPSATISASRATAVTAPVFSCFGPAVPDNSLGGADLDESTLQGVNAATLGGEDLADLGEVGRSSEATSCGDDNHTLPFAPCGSVAIEVPRRARLLVTLSGSADAAALDDAAGPGSGTDSASSVFGQCFFLLDGEWPIAGQLIDLRSAGRDSFSVTTVSDPVDPGSHTLSAGCNEIDGDVDYDTVVVTGVTLSAN